MKFKNKAAADIEAGIVSKGMPADVMRVAQRKLELLLSARSLNDLRVPPGNRLEALKGDRAGQYSIRVNDQYRFCFVFANGEAEEIEFVDYH